MTAQITSALGEALPFPFSLLMAIPHPNISIQISHPKK